MAATVGEDAGVTEIVFVEAVVTEHLDLEQETVPDDEPTVTIQVAVPAPLVTIQPEGKVHDSDPPPADAV